MGTLFRINDNTTPFLANLMRAFPREVARAMKRVGYLLRGEAKAAIGQGGIGGIRWKEKSLAGRFLRMSILKRGKALKSKDRWSRSTKLRKSVFGVVGEAQFLPQSPRLFGRLFGTVRYRFEPESNRVRIGFLNFSASRFAGAVQDARKGTRMLFQYAGQPVTRQMRKAFWAAGIPIAKGKTRLEQPARPLIEPLFRLRHKQIGRWIMESVANSLRGKK